MSKRPNFLVIVADDLGFSDLGCFGGEIKTPNLDRLAAQGTRFTNFHTAAACSPTRSMLMSGTDNHIAGVGAMTEHFNDSYAQEMWVGKPGHEGYLNSSVVSLPGVLKTAGYHTMMSGKWHLGLQLDQTPHARGFDKSFSFLSGCHNHYAWEPQFEDGIAGDEHFKQWSPSNYSSRNMYVRDDSYVQIKPNNPAKPDGFFSTVSFTDQLLDYFTERKATPEFASKPFFAYYAFTAPHFPLQASKERIAVYRGTYDDGPRVLREKRLKGMEKLGLLQPGSYTAHEMVNPLGVQDWDDMTPEEKAKSARAMEAYAAMVEQIDENVGRVIQQLEKDGELDNTFVLFMSDNCGAEGASYEAYPTIGKPLLETINRYYNNDLDNIGEPDSFVWYGNHWAQAATAPGWLFKMWTSLGGIRVPFILRYPTVHKEHLSSGSINTPFCTVMDLMPTILELAGANHPCTNDKPAQFVGRTVQPMRGKSWSKWFPGAEQDIHDQGVPMGWELHGRAAMRIGDFKILWMPPPQGTGQWQLFDVKKDPGETEDLSSIHPDKVIQLLKAWDQYVLDSQVVWGGLSGAGEMVEVDETADAKAWMEARAPKRRPLW